MHDFLSATFQETECTTVYREDPTGTFLGDTQCKGIPVEVIMTMMTNDHAEYDDNMRQKQKK